MAQVLELLIFRFQQETKQAGVKQLLGAKEGLNKSTFLA